MAREWMKLEDVLFAFQRSVARAEQRISASVEHELERAPGTGQFAITEFRVAFPLEADVSPQGEVLARVPDHDVKRADFVEARLTRVDFSLKAILSIEHPSKPQPGPSPGPTPTPKTGPVPPSGQTRPQSPLKA